MSNLIIKDGKKYQIVNINLEDVDDSFAKSIVKIMSRLVFELSLEELFETKLFFLAKIFKL